MQTLETVFGGTRFDPTRPAVFLWEAVTQYLSEESVRQTLAFVGNMAPGSVLLFTYVLKSVIERRSDIPDARKMMDAVAKGNAAWTFGLEPDQLSEFLRPFHLSLIADMGDAEYQKKYLRPLGRDLFVSAVERTAQAVVVAG